MTNESVISVSRDEFNRDLLELHNRVFSQAEDSLILEDMLRPFVDSSWETILVPGDIFSMDQVVFAALAGAAMKMGDDRMIVTESETLPHYGDTLQIIWDQAVVESLRGVSYIAGMELHVYGQSGTWGLMCYLNDFSLLGGTPAVMTAYLETVGGRERARTQFIAYAADAWFEIPPMKQVQILKRVGWSFDDAAT
jgi:hypothetical protein